MSYALLPLVIVLGLIAFAIFLRVVWAGAREELRRASARARVKRELRSLPDRDLADIGITRGDISRIAREAH